MSNHPDDSFDSLLNYFRYDAKDDSDADWDLLKAETIAQFEAGQEAGFFLMCDGLPCRIVAAKTQAVLDDIVAAKNP